VQPLSERERNRVSVQLELDDDLQLVTGDRVQLQQVILNLLRNASGVMRTIDYRPRQLVIRTEPAEEDGVQLSVHDAGVSSPWLTRNPEDLLILFIGTDSQTGQDNFRVAPLGSDAIPVLISQSDAHRMTHSMAISTTGQARTYRQ
jgi:hypothetical protein